MPILKPRSRSAEDRASSRPRCASPANMDGLPVAATTDSTIVTPDGRRALGHPSPRLTATALANLLRQTNRSRQCEPLKCEQELCGWASGDGCDATRMIVPRAPPPDRAERSARPSTPCRRRASTSPSRSTPAPTGSGPKVESAISSAAERSGEQGPLRRARTASSSFCGRRRRLGRRSWRPGGASGSAPTGRRRSRKLGGRTLLAESLERLEASGGSTASSSSRPRGGRSRSILLAEEIGAGKVRLRSAGGATRAESVRAGARGRPRGGARRARARRRPADPPRGGRRAGLRRRWSEGWDGVVPAPAGSRTRSSARTATAVLETVDRSGLVAVQTPQAFLAARLREALAGGEARRRTARRWSRAPAVGCGSSRAIRGSSR